MYLSEQQVRDLADVDEVIRAIRAAFARDSSTTLHMPVRTSLDLDDGAVLLIMPCYDSAIAAAGVKLVAVSRRAGVKASYELLDPATGIVLARMEADYLTDLRTAATSALATDLLARRDAHTLGVFGSGRQASAHFSVLPQVRAFRRFLVCGSGRSDLQEFRERMKKDHGLEIEPVSADALASNSDVICTCTTASTPLFDGRLLRPGAHLNLVGTFRPETREVDDETVKRARVVVETYSAVLAEAGDLLIPLGTGVIGRDHIVADLHEVVCGKTQGRIRPEDITLYKSVGCALEDLVTASLIYKKAGIYQRTAR
jgi:ornithine cyclodeaminase/alanine dehydrogenase-like protein (mu-crystallin family)